MKKINFKAVEVCLDIQGDNKTTQDVSKDFSNLIYQYGKGIESHALALKIYNSKGEEEYSEDECSIIVQTANTCAPFFIDAINNILNNENNQE